MSNEMEKTIELLTDEEKAALCSGTDFMFTNPIPRLKIPALRMADGPHGLRVQVGKSDNGVAKSLPATSFPTATAIASSWDEETAYLMGQAIAKECKHYGVDILLGPGLNIKRNPLAGRNFEYFSEDPFLAAKTAIFEVKGLQSEGVGACVKHFALNNAENYRFLGDSVADSRAINEIYLKAFERVVKESKPYAVMSAYNKINGEYCSENKWLLTDVLRKSWGFDGVVMTDWGGINDREKALKAGLDLEMPGDTAICRKRLIDGFQSGRISKEEKDGAIKNILRLIEKCKEQGSVTPPDWAAHHRLSGEIATRSAVLLKNDGSLPLKKEEKLFVVGELFEKMRYQGAGSSMINPTFLTTPKDAFDIRGIDYTYEKGYTVNEEKAQSELLKSALEKANGFEKAIVFIGLTDDKESEGADREDMRLPENQLALVKGLIEKGKKVVAVVFGGSTFELPFEKDLSAVLDMFLPGQNGGEATASLLFGEVNPSGKLAETWVNEYADIPFANEFSKSPIERYKESVFVGYRYFSTAKKSVLYPFGHGLSYTEFKQSNLIVEKNGNALKITCAVENVGNRFGAEVVQVYVCSPKTELFKPIRELRAFQKVYLLAGEKKTVSLKIDLDDLCVYHPIKEKWIFEGGRYEICLCQNADTVLEKVEIDLDGERVEPIYSKEVKAVYEEADFEKATDELFEKMSGLKIPTLPKKKPITIESQFSDIKVSLICRLVYYGVTSLGRKQIKKAKKLPDGTEKENMEKGGKFLLRIFESNTLRAMSMSAGSRFPYNFAEGIMHLSNGKFFKAIGCFLRKIKVPKLPKDK